MEDAPFPTESYLDPMVRFLDITKHEATNYTREQRVRNLHYAYSKAAAHFAEPKQQQDMKASPKRLQATLQSNVGLAVYSNPKVLPELMVELSIHFTYKLILNDSISDDPTPP